MMGGFVSRVLLLVFGYAYPAYECYKTVELNKPEIEQLIFWCQYWILVALLTVLERFGDFTISWLPFYSEAKLMFFIYLWYPKTKGTTYIYGTFFKPYISQHENEIDRNLLELRARASDTVVLYFQKAASVGQNTFFDVLKYVATQSQSQKSRQRPHQEPQQPQQQQPQFQQQQQQQQTQKQAPPVMRRAASIAARQAAMAQQSQEIKTVPSSPKIKRQASAKAGSVASTKSATVTSAAKPDESTKKSEVKPAVEQVQTPATNAESPKSEPSAPPLPEAEGVDKMAVDEVNDTAEGTEELDPAVEVEETLMEETPMEETIRVTCAKLRRRTAAEDPAGN
ncbi:putative HVA22-like protein g [Phragmites australis]|uniref:putative HVA22-like protein g n=1 Tax=Phragmites australis TaxID=29695 RepID=UPI002D76D724|nr:putative HVA22-like protein g [Phragmites australis]